LLFFNPCILKFHNNISYSESFFLVTWGRHKEISILKVISFKLRDIFECNSQILSWLMFFLFSVFGTPIFMLKFSCDSLLFSWVVCFL
jgi:hypothetical protein